MGYGPLERVEFESVTERMGFGHATSGERFKGFCDRGDGAGAFREVLDGTAVAGIVSRRKQRLADELVARGYVVLLVDSYATRQASITPALRAALPPSSGAGRMPTGLSSSWLAKPSSIHIVWLRSASRQALGLPSRWRRPIRSNSSSLEGNLRFRVAAAFYPPCKQAVGRPGIPTLIFIGALDDWTPAADCSDKIASWGNDGPPIELVVYPGAYHGFYYSHLQPGTSLFDHWLEYNGEAADDASHRLHWFLDRHLN